MDTTSPVRGLWCATLTPLDARGNSVRGVLVHLDDTWSAIRERADFKALFAAGR